MRGRWRVYVAAGVAIISGFAVFFGTLAQTRGNFILAILLALLAAHGVKAIYSFIAQRRKWPDYTYSDFLSDIFTNVWW